MGFMQSNGGTTGNWNIQDHVKFVKIYNTWKDVSLEIAIEKTMKELKRT